MGTAGSYFVTGSLASYAGVQCARGLRVLKTPLANYYVWLNKHWKDRGQMPGDLIAQIAAEEPQLIFAPELHVSMMNADADGASPWDTYAEELDAYKTYHPFLDAQGRNLMMNGQVPVYFSDLVQLGEPEYDIGVSVDDMNDPETAEKIETAFWVSALSKALRSGLDAALLALLVKSGVRYGLFLSRRRILTLVPITAGLLAGSAASFGVNTTEPGWQSRWSRKAAWYPFSVNFRNALIAAKLQTLALQLQQEGSGHKPAFLLTLGLLHENIMHNLAEGLDFNLNILKEFGSKTADLGPFWDHGYLFDAADRLGLGTQANIPLQP